MSYVMANNYDLTIIINQTVVYEELNNILQGFSCLSNVILPYDPARCMDSI